MIRPEDLFATVQAQPGAVWLDGVDGWSILTWDPREVVTDATDWVSAGRRLAYGPVTHGVPFSGGCIAAIAYEAGHRVLPVPPGRPTPEPESWLARYDGAWCYRHADNSWHLGGSARFAEGAVAAMEHARVLPPPAPCPPARVRSSLDQAAFVGRVRAIRDLLEQGDCYQVNLTRAVHVDGVVDPFEAYRRVRANRADRGAFLRIRADLAVLCNSPEVLLDIDDDTARSVPIKGTAPRCDDPQADAASAAMLRASEKDLAELTMIVDLVRNDLGRVAVPGSVVAGPRQVTPHGNVHHAVQEVSAVLRAGCDAWEALAATFPPGSVTGTPKVRACQRISQLETEARGVYCGAIGYASPEGKARFNVAIRTAVWHAGALRYHVGGGIVHASDPVAEWEETVAKGSAMARAYAGVDRA